MRIAVALMLALAGCDAGASLAAEPNSAPAAAAAAAPEHAKYPKGASPRGLSEWSERILHELSRSAVRRSYGTVHMRLTVGLDGHSNDCVVTQSSGKSEFDEAVCKAMMAYARFWPALDGNGKPIASSVVHTLTMTEN